MREETQGQYSAVSPRGEVCAGRCRSTVELLAAKKRRGDIGARSLSGDDVKEEDVTWSMSAGGEREVRRTSTKAHIRTLHGMIKTANTSKAHRQKG